MNRALEDYERHVAEIRKTVPKYRASLYGFAYWLFRWSGHIGPDGAFNSNGRPTRKGKGP